MTLYQEKIYTLDDIYALPDGQRAELIDGRMYMMSPPTTTHQRVASMQIYTFAFLKCWVNIAALKLSV